MGPNGQDFTRFFCLIEHPQLNPGVRFIFLGVPKVRGCVIFTLQVLKGRLGVGVGFSPHLARTLSSCADFITSLLATTSIPTQGLDSRLRLPLGAQASGALEDANL